MRSSLRRSLDDMYDWIESTHRAFQRRKQVKFQLREMGGGTFVSDEEYRDVFLKYWKAYGQRPKKFWMNLYAKPNIKFDPRYIPDDLWFSHILPYYSNMQFRRPYEDKCMHDRLFPDLIRPVTVAKCMAGVDYSRDNNLLTRSELLDEIMIAEPVIIKPSIDSGTGRLIQFFDPRSESLDTLENRINDAGSNFIVQEIVRQHASMDELFAGSLNTVRVVTFLFKGEVHVLSVICRMGAGKARVDNVSAGGLQIAVDKDGHFADSARDKFRVTHFQHPDTGTVFENFCIPSFNEIIASAKREQKRLPHFKIVGWDFAINEDGDPVFIEYNVCPGSNQMSCGPTFGDMTEEVLTDVFLEKSLEGSGN